MSKLLFLGASPDDKARIRTDRELGAIKECLERPGVQPPIELAFEPAVKQSRLIEHLIDHQPDIVHVCCHGQTRGLEVEDEAGRSVPVDVAEFAGAMARLSNPVRCLVMNACDSAQHLDMARAHIPRVIAVHGAVDDRQAIGFSKAFYQALVTGYSVRAAFELGHRALGTAGLRTGDVRYELATGTGASPARIVFVQPAEQSASRPPGTRTGTHAQAVSASAPSRTRLAILLERQGPMLHVRYQQPGQAPSQPFSLAWDHIAETMNETSAVLDRGDPDKLRAWLDQARHSVGPALFRLLFGEPAQWQPVLRDVFDQPTPLSQPNPIFAGVDVHITTTDPQLIALPWRLTTWDSWVLAENGWRFAITRQAEPPGRHDMEVPDEVIAIVPEAAAAGANHALAQHRVALGDVVQAAGGGHQRGAVRWVQTDSELASALAGSRDGQAIVYLCAAVEQHAGQPCLVLHGARGPEHIPVQRLVTLLRQHPPRLVYLNTHGAVLNDPLATEAIPLVIWRRTSHWTASAHALAVDWFERWLTARGDSIADRGGDPIAALHQVCQERNLSHCSEAATVLVRRHYSEWTVRRRVRASKTVAPIIALDRDGPKAMIAKHLRELAQSRTQRVLAIVAHAKPGNQLSDLWQQLRYELEQQGE
ncbi:MAG: CHAT domain-containing protein, partial [Myxococcota bacterium]